jgi:hypothetical protein
MIKIMKMLSFSFLLILISFVVACNEHNGKEEDLVMNSQDFVERWSISTYANAFAFWDDINNKSWIHGVHEDSWDYYSRVVLVLSPDERKDFPEDVLVLWPTEHTHRMLRGLNYEVRRTEIDLSMFSLEYPITIENIVYDREKVAQLWTTPPGVGGIHLNRQSVRRGGGEDPHIEETTNNEEE